MRQESSLPTECPKDSVEQPNTENATDHLNVVITYLIAGISLFSAFLAWWATNIDPSAYNQAGIKAVLNTEMTQTINTAALYRSYRVYTSFALADELRRQVDAGIAELHPRDRVGLEQQLNQMARIAPIRQRFFPQHYLNRDGSYDAERQMGEAWAQAKQNTDLDAQQHFANGLLQRARIYHIALDGFRFDGGPVVLHDGQRRSSSAGQVALWVRILRRFSDAGQYWQLCRVRTAHIGTQCKNLL